MAKLTRILTVAEVRRAFGFDDPEWDDIFDDTEPDEYDAKAEADAAAWARAERTGARQSRPLVQSEHEARRRRLAADPTSILDDDESDYPRIIDEAYFWPNGTPPTGGPWTHTFTITVDAGAFSAALNRLSASTDRLARSFGFLIRRPDPIEESVLAFARMATIQTRTNRLAAARKRHGSAAMCPRHGPTVGGLCRRCVR